MDDVLRILTVYYMLTFQKFLFQLVIWKKRNEDLAEVIPKECLPEEYGGTEKSVRKLRGKCPFPFFSCGIQNCRTDNVVIV